MRIFSKLRSSLVLIGTALVIGAGLSTGTAQAVDPYFDIRAGHSGKCVDVHAASQDHGRIVIQGNCVNGTNQLWRLRSMGNRYYQIRAQHSDKCLDVENASVAHGARIVQANCTDPNFNQHWYRVDAPNRPGFYSLRARHSGKCLDVANASVAHGALIVQGDCWNGANQHWTSPLIDRMV